MKINQNEAAEALLAMQDARIRANEMKRLPFAYHIAFGALMGGWVGIQGLAGGWFVIALSVFILGTVAMYRWQLKATSRWINGFRLGRTLWVAGLLVAVSVGLLLTSNPRMPTFELFTPLQGGLLAFVAVAFLDWLWVKAYDAELRTRS